MAEWGERDEPRLGEPPNVSVSRGEPRSDYLAGRDVFDALEDGVVAFDPALGRILDVNRKASALFGLDPAQLLALCLWQLSAADVADAQHSMAAFASTAVATGQAQFDWRFRRADGKPFWTEVRLLRSPVGKNRWLVAVIRDTDALKAALEESRLADERYRSLVKNLPKSAIILCDQAYRIVLVDGPEVGLSGITKEHMEGRTIYESLPPDFVAAIEPNIRRVLAGESFSAEIPFDDLWYTYNYVPIFDEAGSRVVYAMILAVNVTERRRAEDSLRKSEERFLRIFQSSVDAIAVMGAADGVILEVNPAFERTFGWRRSEAIGKTTRELDMWPDPESRERVLHQLVQGDAPDYVERQARRRDGTMLDGMVSLREIELDSVACYLCTFRDVTEHKRAERERERLFAELTARNAEMEQFTFTVSHDLKSPLVTITGFLGMLQRDMAAGDTARMQTDIARIGSAATKMMRLLSDLLQLSRIGQTAQSIERLKLSEVVHDALELLSAAVSEGKVQVELVSDFPEVVGDRVRLTQVVQNLVENAIKYMGDQSTPRVRIGVRPDPNYVVCFVSDNGVGIDPRYGDRIFGLFEKLNPRSEGTGIGLALVRRILEAHGGSVWVEAGVERGSTFVFRLPRPPSSAPSFAHAPEGALRRSQPKEGS